MAVASTYNPEIGKALRKSASINSHKVFVFQSKYGWKVQKEKAKTPHSISKTKLKAIEIAKQLKADGNASKIYLVDRNTNFTEI